VLEKSEIGAKNAIRPSRSLHFLPN